MDSSKRFKVATAAAFVAPVFLFYVFNSIDVRLMLPSLFREQPVWAFALAWAASMPPIYRYSARK